MFSTFPTTRARNTTSKEVLPPGGIICSRVRKRGRERERERGREREKEGERERKRERERERFSE